MSIRRLRPGDRETYLAFARDFYHSPAVLAPVPDEYLARAFDELTRSDAYLAGYLAEIDGAPAGYALVPKIYAQESGGMVCWIDELYVAPAYRGRGLGQALLARVEADHPEARAFRLEVEPENGRAAALYRRLGYRPLGYQSYRKEREP